MRRYYLKKGLVAIGIFLLGLSLLFLVFGLVFWSLSFNLAQQSQDNPLYLAVSVGGIAGLSVVIVEGMLSFWRYYEKKSETRSKRAIIRAMSHSPTGRDFDSIKRKIEEDNNDIPDQVIKNLLDDLVMTGALKVNLTTRKNIEYYLSKQKFITPTDL